jgi:hypothetical protein
VRRREAGEPLLDAATSTARVVFSEYEAHMAQYSTISSKGMLRLIRRKGSSRSLLAALHEDNPLHNEETPPASPTPPGPSLGPDSGPWVGSTSWGGGGEVAQGSGRIGSAGSSLGRSVERALMYGLEHRGQVGESEDDEDGEEEGARSQNEEGGLSDEQAEQGGEPEEGSVDGSTMASDEDASVSGGGGDEASFQDTWAGGKASGKVRVGEQGRLTTLAEQEEGLRHGEQGRGEGRPGTDRAAGWGRPKSSPVAVPLDGDTGGVLGRGRSPGKSFNEWRRSHSARGRLRPSSRAASDGGSTGSSPAGHAL